MPGLNLANPSTAMFAEMGLVDPSSGKFAFDPTGGTGHVSDYETGTQYDPEGRRVRPNEDPADRLPADRDDDKSGDDVPDLTQRQKPQDKPAERDSRLLPVDTESQDQSRQDQQNAPDWNSDDNPYKPKAPEISDEDRAAQVRQHLSDYERLRTSQAREALVLLTSQRDDKGQPVYNAAAVEAQIAQQLRTDLLEARTIAERVITQPVAVRYMAEKIVKEVGGNVRVEDIIHLPTVDAMKAVAERIKNMPANASGSTPNQQKSQQAPQPNARDAAFQARRESGVDTVETGAPLSRAVDEAFQKLSPRDKIRYSLMYDQAAS